MIEKSSDVSFFLSRITSLTTPASPTADKSGRPYTADALRRSIRLLLSKVNDTSSLGSVIDFSGGATITLGSAKKYFVLLLFPSRIVK